jgi:hypothetical protein
MIEPRVIILTRSFFAGFAPLAAPSPAASTVFFGISILLNTLYCPEKLIVVKHNKTPAFHWHKFCFIIILLFP